MSPEEHRRALGDLGSSSVVALASPRPSRIGAVVVWAFVAGLVLACTPLSWSSSGGVDASTDEVAHAERVPSHEPGSADLPVTNEASSSPVAKEDPAARPRDAARPAEASAKSAGDAPKSNGTGDAEEGDDATGSAGGDVRIVRGEGLLPLLVPRGEELAFEVEIDLGALGEPTVGQVTLSSGADPYVQGLPSKTTATTGAASRKRGLEVGWIKSTARGKHLGYELDHELYVRHLPQVMPRVLFTDTQKGSENRRRRMKIGAQDDKTVCTYEHDGHCKGCTNQEHFVESKWLWGKPYHCEKCKRMEHREWKPSLTRTVPTGALDMLSAVYLARTMVREGLVEADLPLIDKQTLWQVHLERGERKRVRVPAGRFDCIEVRLVTSVPPGEKSSGEGFQGLFGIQGSIHMWFEATTGVPVLISGTLPVPVLGDLDVRVELASFKGTPAGFVAQK